MMVAACERQRRSKTGMGLKIMSYRANMIGAALQILHRDGGGTLIRCTLQQAAEGESHSESQGEALTEHAHERTH